MSGILVGGILGAAAAMYFNRTNRTFSFSGMSSAGRTIDNMVEKARSRIMTPDRRSSFSENEGGLEQVESIVREDPVLEKQVNEIMSDSTGSTNVR